MNSRYPRTLAMIVGLVGAQATYAQSAALEAAAREVASIHGEVQLPSSTGLVVPVPAAARVTVARTGLYLDLVELFREATPEEREAFESLVAEANFPIGHVRRVAPLDEFAYIDDDEAIPPPDRIGFALSQLQLLAELEALARRSGEFALIVHADRDAPHGLVEQVVRFVREDIRRVNDFEPFRSIAVAVAADGGARVLASGPYREPVAAHDRQAGEPTCAAPLLYVGDAGTAMIAVPRDPRGARIAQPRVAHVDDAPPPDPPWSDQVVVATADSCPWLPLSGLPDIVERLHSYAPACALLSVGAESSVRWGNVIEPVTALLRDGGPHQVELYVGRLFPEQACGAALVLSTR